MEIKFKNLLTLETLTDFKNLHQNEFMDEFLVKDAEDIEQDVLGFKLTPKERENERQLLLSPAIVRAFVDIKTEELDKAHAMENLFYRLGDEDQKTCLKYLLALRQDMKRAVIYRKKITELGIHVDCLPEKFLNMTDQELQSEIDGWRITFDAR